MAPGEALRWFLTIWLVSFAGLIAYGILIGRISVAGVLTTDGQKFSPERLQLLILTISGLWSFVAAALAQHGFPAIPDYLLALLAASQSVFLGGKIARLKQGASTGSPDKD